MNHRNHRNYSESQTVRSALRKNLFVILTGLSLGGLAFVFFGVGVAGEGPREQGAPPALRTETLDGPSSDAPLDDASGSDSEDGHIEMGLLAGRARNVLPPPVHHFRPEAEWQGMLVDLSMQAICDTEDSCGLAMSCRDNQCGPCRFDDDCPARESCVLDHCVPTRNVGCSGAFDCASGELCVLSGYSPDPRGNADMHAFCQPSEGGAPTDADDEAYEIEPGPPAEPRPVSIADLRNALLEDAIEDPSEEPTRLPEPEREPFDQEREEQLFQESDPIDFIDPEDEFVPVEELQSP